MLSLATVTLSPSSPAISSSAGPIIRHGPHHSAQKSTSTGRSAPRTSEAKLWSVTVLVAMAGESPGGVQLLAGIWAFAFALSRHEFDELRTGCVQQGRADPPPRKNDPKRLGISGHLRAVGLGDVCIRCRHSAGLVVDDGYGCVVDQDPVDGAGDHTAVGKRRREWHLR